LLWANKNDLSLSSGNDCSSKTSNLIELLDSFKENILCDNTEPLWTYLTSLKEQRGVSNRRRRIDIVLDNCSIELAADLILCDFLLRNDLADEIKLHGKAFYWFVSDVTRADFDQLLLQIQSANSIVLGKFAHRMHTYLAESKLHVDFSNSFWTSPHAFSQMRRVAPQLYTEMELNSSLVIMKGDLNYRKLLGDLDWPFDMPLGKVTGGFLPTSLCAVRTLKSDLVACLDTNETTNPRYGRVDKSTSKWMTSGDYGIIQFLDANK
jgi:hypothetical protein